MNTAIAAAADVLDLPAAISGRGMSPAMQIMLDDKLFERAKQIATYLSKAEGFLPGHLIGKPEACFAVVMRSLTWKLDPYAVAQCTYQTPGGRVGFEGKLCQAILENSGKLEGPVKFEHYGDWSRVKGKWKTQRSDRGKEYPVPTWTREDAKGLGVRVIAQVIGEAQPRELDYDLDDCFPLNSTLWATKPKQQICYTAVRAFANLAAPGLFMGIPFDREDFGDEPMRDVTPPAPPKRSDFGSTDEPKQGQVESRPVHDVEESGTSEASGRVESDDEQKSSTQHQPAAEKKMATKATGFQLKNGRGKVVQEKVDPPTFIVAIAKLFEAAELRVDVEAIYKQNADTIRALPENVQKPIVEAYDQALVALGQP